ncbi:F-box/FBD/LRR-repeat protein-like protein [Tanacetum coccineum]
MMTPLVSTINEWHANDTPSLRIDNLPPGILENILCFLPIQEAVRTCILSREWRYCWIKIPKLVFIEDKFQVSTDGAEFSVLEQTFDTQRERIRMLRRRKLLDAINQVLSMHEGTIQEFTLSMELDVHCDEIDHIFSQFGKKKYRQEIKISYPSLFCTVRPQGASFY